MGKNNNNTIARIPFILVKPSGAVNTFIVPSLLHNFQFSIKELLRKTPPQFIAGQPLRGCRAKLRGPVCKYQPQFKGTIGTSWRKQSNEAQKVIWGVLGISCRLPILRTQVLSPPEFVGTETVAVEPNASFCLKQQHLVNFINCLLKMTNYRKPHIRYQLPVHIHYP